MRYKPPLAVIVIGRPKSLDWCLPAESGAAESDFINDLFRCLSYDIGNSHASNPSIPVYFSLGDFDPTGATSPPPSINVAIARRVLVLVLLDADFRRATSQWSDFFGGLRKHAQASDTDLRFVPMARTDDGQLGRDIKRLGLGKVAPICIRGTGDRFREPHMAGRYFRISAMIAAIRQLYPGTEKDSPIDIFISYAKRDGEESPSQLRQALGEYTGIRAVVDTMAINPGASVDANSIEQKLTSASCVIICQGAEYSERIWCQREALLAKRSDVAMVVVEMLDGLERSGGYSLGNCPRLRLKMGIKGHVDEVVELAVSEILRIAYHRARCAAVLIALSLDPQRVEILVRAPEPLRLIDLIASNSEATRMGRPSKDIVLHPDPPLREHELNLLRMVDSELRFLTPSTIVVSSAGAEDL